MEKIDDPLQNDFGTLSQKTGLKPSKMSQKIQKSGNAPPPFYN